MVLIEENSGKYSPDILMESVTSILGSNTLASLATASGADGMPCIATVFFSWTEDLKLYFLSDAKTVHGKNIIENPNVSVSVYDSTQEWASLKKGLQIYGTAVKTPVTEIPKTLASYAGRFSDLKKWVSAACDLNHLDSRFFTITSEHIKIFDEPEFGEEVWIETLVER